MALPSASVMMRASQMAIDEDKPIYLDYFRGSLEKTCKIGVQEDKKQFLVKSSDEYTSSIQSVLKCENCYIVATENSLYIVSSDILIRRIATPPTTSE
jgi:hypothetical protein